jgi:hypothetical protein
MGARVSETEGEQEAEEVEPDPIGQDELATLEAELREALQHQRAAVARVQETQAKVQELMRRARALLERIEGPEEPAGPAD